MRSDAMTWRIEVRSLRRSPAKHIDLLPQDQVFRFQRCSRLEARSQDTENQLEQIGHQDASLRRPLAASTPNRIFGTHRASRSHCLDGLLLGTQEHKRANSMLFVNQTSFGGAFRRIHQQRHAFYSIEDSSVHRRHARELAPVRIVPGRT
jgi:hypothetical protein